MAKTGRHSLAEEKIQVVTDFVMNECGDKCMLCRT